MTYEIDYSGWPLVRVRAGGELSSDGAQIAVSAFEALLARRTPFAVAYDASAPRLGAGPVVWDWIGERRADLDAYCLAWATCVPDETLRSLTEEQYARYTAGRMPLRTFATWPETEGWAGDQVRRLMPRVAG